METFDEVSQRSKTLTSLRSLLRMLKNEYSELLWMSSSPNVRICVIGMLINLKVLAILRQTLKEKVHIKENLYNWGGRGEVCSKCDFFTFSRDAEEVTLRRRGNCLTERGWAPMQCWSREVEMQRRPFKRSKWMGGGSSYISRAAVDFHSFELRRQKLSNNVIETPEDALQSAF